MSQSRLETRRDPHGRLEEARAAEKAGQHTAARDAYEQALRLLADTGEEALAASIFRWIGSSYRDEGDAEAALDCYQASLTVAELYGDAVDMARALNCIGIIYWRWGRLDEADRIFDEAQQLAGKNEEVRLVAMVEQNRGVVANIRGDLVRALHHYQRSLERYRELGDEQFIGNVLNNLAMIHTDLEEWDQAETFFAESAAICEKIGDLQTRTMVEVNRTELFTLKGDYTAARESCDSAFELASGLEQRLAMGEVYKWYGIIYRETGKYSLAETHLQTAAEYAERYTNPLLAGEVQRELAQVYRAQDRNRETLQALNYAHRVFTELRAQLDLADVDRRIGDLEELYLQVVRKWGESIESKDRYTAGHCQRVADYSCMLAEELGFDEQTMTWFRMGAFLHDVGKTVVPAEILNKPGKFTEDEWEIMKRHTTAGEELLSTIEFPWDVRPMIRSHHEHWCGTGYPDGLKGKAIPLPARILTLADVYDALTTTRSYRKAFSPEKALAIMEEDTGRIFDPALYPVFRRLMEARLKTETFAGGA